jgi:hypothetical protein
MIASMIFLVKAFAINQRQKSCLLTATQCLGKVMEAIAAQLLFDFWTIDLGGH